MNSIDALARAIKEYEGGVVIVSHDFRMFCRPPRRFVTSNPHSPGLISQVANELWEVKGRKIHNLTKKDINIADYKKMLIRNSMFSGSRKLSYRLTDKRRFRRVGEGQAVQQNCRQGQDINVHDNPAFVLLYHVTSVVRPLRLPYVQT